MANLYNVPLKNAVQKQLSAILTTGETGTITLDSSVVAELQASSSMPGVLVVDRIDSTGTETPNKREYIVFTGVSGSTVTGLTRGVGGSTAQEHSIGAIVEFVPDVVWAQAINDVIQTEHNYQGKHTAITASSASINNLEVLNSFGIGVNRLNGSTASLSVLRVSTHLNASGASITGITTTGGFNPMFFVPGSLASQANVAGLIPVPNAFTASFIQAFVQTPASLASVSVLVRKNFSDWGIITIPAGATYASSASLSSGSLIAGDHLTLTINSTASLATDLSVLVRAI